MCYVCFEFSLQLKNNLLIDENMSLEVLLYWFIVGLLSLFGSARAVYCNPLFTFGSFAQCSCVHIFAYVE
jgi:hypothetical protein